MVYIVSASAVMWLHNTAAIFPLVTGLIFLCAIWAIPSYRGLRFANLCIATGLIALLYVPHVSHIVAQTVRLNMHYIPAPSVDRLLWIFQQIYGDGYLPLVLLALFLLATIAWARRGQWERVAFAVLGWLVAPIILILFSFWKPILQPKLLVWPLMPFLATCAVGLALLPWSFARVVLLAVLVAWNLQGVAQEWNKVRQNIKGIYQTFSKEASSDATVVVCPPSYLGLSRYYLEKQGRGEVPVHTLNRGRQEVAGVMPDGDPGGRVDPTELFVKYQEIWLMSLCGAKANPLMKVLEEKGRLTQQWEFRGRNYFELRRYERRE